MENNIYMSLFSNDDYLYPIIAMMWSGKNTQSKYSYYLLVTDNVSETAKDIVKHLGCNLIEIPEGMPDSYIEMRKSLDPQCQEQFGKGHGKKSSDAGGQHTFSKFKVFDLTQFNKILFLDCDIIFLHNTDYLFEYPTLGSVSGQPQNFCSGCMLVQPNHALYQSLVNYANSYTTLNQGMPYDDYMVLRDFFHDWGSHHEQHFNVTGFYNLFECNNGNSSRFVDWPKIDCLHMTGSYKPGRCGYATAMQWSDEGYCAKMGYVYYLDILNQGIEYLQQRGFNQLELIQ